MKKPQYGLCLKLQFGTLTRKNSIIIAITTFNQNEDQLNLLSKNMD
jgi:hypothetical protein